MKLPWMVLACAFATAVFADTLTLRDGSVVNGDYAGGDTRTIRMMVGDRVRTFRVGDVVSLTFGPGGGDAAMAPIAPPPSPPDASGLQTQRAYEQYNPNAAGIQIPSGTPVIVRMIDGVDSQRDPTGATFRASVDEPVVVNGQTIIPRNSDALVKLVQAQQSGRMTGKAALTLALQQVSINGRMVDTYTEAVTQTSGSKGRKTAAETGGGAVLGTVIGALAGGGRGAAIGALGGGAAGAGVAVATGGEKVQVPSETRLTFTLQTPVQL
jgi:hypothetical protein